MTSIVDALGEDLTLGSRSRTHGTSTFQCHTTSQITIQRIMNNLACVDRHTEILAGKARSLLHNISSEFSRLLLGRILCHGAHDKAKNLAEQASGKGRSSEFFAGWPTILNGHSGPFWVSSYVCGGFSDSCSDSCGGTAGAGIVVTLGSSDCRCFEVLAISVFLGHCGSRAVPDMQAVHIGLLYCLTFLRWLLSGP